MQNTGLCIDITILLSNIAFIIAEYIEQIHNKLEMFKNSEDII